MLPFSFITVNGEEEKKVGWDAKRKEIHES